MGIERLKKTSSLSKFILTAVMAFGMNAANAGDFYLGLGVGQGKLSGVEDVVIGIDYDDTADAFKLAAGYNIIEYFGVELEYADLGAYTGTASGVQFRDQWEAYGISLNAVGIFPIGEKFTVFGKLGYTSWRVKDVIDFASLQQSAGADGNDLSYGAGASFNVNEVIGVRLEYQRFTGLGDEFTNIEEGADVGLLTLGVTLTF